MATVIDTQDEFWKESPQEGMRALLEAKGAKGAIDYAWNKMANSALRQDSDANAYWRVVFQLLASEKRDETSKKLVAEEKRRKGRAKK